MTATPLWTSADADTATGGRSTAPWSASGVSIDSRSLRKDDLFVALEGPNFDGHDFLAAAFDGGAAAAMVARPPESQNGIGPCLSVGDTMDALTKLGRAARVRTKARVIAVTGSVGKTGVKEALRTVLERQGPTYATEGNLNNHWGAPLSLARLAADRTFGVFELGMNHPGELTPLSKMVEPHVVIITTIAPAHVEFFDSIEQVADAKAEIFAGMTGGFAIVNRDNDQFGRLAAAAARCGVEQILSFGADEEADVRLLASTMEAGHSDVTADIAGTRISYRVGAPGHHWVINSLAVLGAAKAAGADVIKAAEALADLTPPKGRGARHMVTVQGGQFELIDDAYNASPAAMRAAIQTLALAQPGRDGRRVAVLGDMLELGAEAPVLHAALAETLVEHGIDLVLTAGPNMAHLNKALPRGIRGSHAEDAEKLKPIVLETVMPGDVVCVKGSLGSRMGQIVDALLDDAKAA